MGNFYYGSCSSSNAKMEEKTMGEMFRDFLNDCANRYGKIIEANLYSSGWATIKVETQYNKILELTIRLEGKNEGVTENAQTI